MQSSLVKLRLDFEAKMTTHFITAEVNLQENPAKLQQEIEAELNKRGEPLRWAVTQVDSKQQVAQVEAIVITADDRGAWG